MYKYNSPFQLLVINYAVSVEQVWIISLQTQWVSVHVFVCLTLLASFFLPSHLSFKNMYVMPYCTMYRYMQRAGVG